MACKGSHWSKYAHDCAQCGKSEPEVKLTRHHERTSDLKKTGKIIVLCKQCHEEVHYIEKTMNDDMILKLNDEIKATEVLLSEGNPFTLTQNEYLDNLKSIRGDIEISTSLKQESVG